MAAASGLARAGIALLAFIACMASARAEETISELTQAGLDLSATPLTLESQEVVIGQKTIDLKYKLINQTASPVETTLTLPFPEIDFSDPDSAWAIPGANASNFIGLVAKIDNQPATFDITQSATVDGKDMTATLQQNGLSLIPVGAFHNQLASLAPEARNRLANAGLIAQSGTSAAGAPIYVPRWTAHANARKPLTVAPGKAVTVSLRYLTSIGIARDTVLREPLRSQKPLAGEVERRKADYCVDHGFLVGIDKIVTTAVEELTKPLEPIPAAAPFDLSDVFSNTPEPAKPEQPKTPPVVRIFPEANVAELRERHIAFDIGAGAPATPIKSFRLVVDKGKQDRLVSFCLDNLKRLSATAFEMRATNYHPAGLLRVLSIGRK